MGVESKARLFQIFNGSVAAWTTTAVIACVGLAAVLPTAPANAVSLAAVFPPWWSQGQVWRAAMSTGDVIDVGSSRFVLVLHSNASGLAARLRRAGALLVLDPLTMGVCARPTEEEKS